MRSAALLIAALLLSAVASGSPDERLVDQFGHPVPPSELASRWLLVYFGYSQCSDICPMALTRMSEALTQLGEDGEMLLPLFVTLDPAHDTPQVLRRYAAHFSPRLRALTGTPAAVADAARTFGVPWKHSTGGGLDHGVFMYLVAPDGTLAEQFHPQTSAAAIAQRVREDLRGAHR
jgi:protein SCO1/2